MPEERELHNLTHLPLSSWCKICLRAKSRGDYHKQQYDRRPLVQADYDFLVDKGTKQEILVLSCIDFTTGMASSCYVPQKGAIDYPIAELHRFVMECGRSQGVLQTDQEAFIRALIRGLVAYTGLSVRQAPTFSSESQWSIERYHGTLWQQAPTPREAVKTNYDGFDIKAYDDLTTWLAMHATRIYNRYLLHSDGQASHERYWGRTYNRSVCEFAETLLYKPMRQDTPKAEIKWHYGIWHGKCTQSDDHYIGTPSGVIRTTGIKRLPRSERYQIKYLKRVACTSWQPRGAEEAYLSVLPGPSEVVPPGTHGPPGRGQRGKPNDAPDYDQNGDNTTDVDCGGQRRGRGDYDEPPVTQRRAVSPTTPATTHQASAEPDGAPVWTRWRI